MLYSIKMNSSTPAPLDVPGTGAAGSSKVAVRDANPPSCSVVKSAEEVKAENSKGLLATMYEDQAAPANVLPDGSVAVPAI
jgi:hypothetical protein